MTKNKIIGSLKPLDNDRDRVLLPDEALAQLEAYQPPAQPEGGLGINDGRFGIGTYGNIDYYRPARGVVARSAKKSP